MSKFIPALFVALILGISLLLTGCDLEAEQIPTPIEEEPQFPDPVEDLVAYLSSSFGRLLVDPAYRDEVIEMLGLMARVLVCSCFCAEWRLRNLMLKPIQ